MSFVNKNGLREVFRERPQAIFTEYQGNPLIGPSGKSGDWREFGVSGPLVILNPEDNKYYMFCRGFSGGRWGAGAVPQIGLFTSDDGLHWEEYPNNPVIPRGGAGEWDEGGVNSSGGTIVWDEDSEKWRLYYWGKNAAGRNRGCGVAESDDLINWTKRAENPVIPGHNNPNNTRFAGVFNRREASPKWIGIVFNTYNRLERWTSDDGINWTYDRDLVFAPPFRNILIEPIYPMVSEVFCAQKLFGLFTLIAEDWAPHYYGQRNIIAFCSYDSIHWWQVPIHIYSETGYLHRNSCSGIIHPYILLARDGAFLYHANAYKHKDGGVVEWIEVAFIDPKWLLEVLTSQGVYYIWDDENVTADTYGYMYVNKLNFREATIYFKSDTAGDLTVEVDPDGYGDWYTLYTRTGITEDVSKTMHDFTHLRMKFSVDATLTAKVVLKK